MTLEEAENVLVKEFKKPTKLRDSALIAMTQRDTLKQRRLFIEKKTWWICRTSHKKVSISWKKAVFVST